MTDFGRNWALITSDYAGGPDTANGTRAIVEENGGRTLEQVLAPQNKRDSSLALKLESYAAAPVYEL